METPEMHFSRTCDLGLLAESEERYRAVMTALTVGVLFLDKQGIVRMWNTSAEYLLGLSAEQLRGDMPFDQHWRAIHEDGSPFPRNAYPAWFTLKTGKPCFGIIMGIEKPGSDLTWLSITSRAIFHNQEQTPAAAIVSFSDITEYKRTEQSLRESERFARATVDALSSPIAVLDETGAIVTVNKAWRDFAVANASRTDGLCEGANYLTVCDSATGAGGETAKEFAAGIRSVMRGERDLFALEYDCPSPREQGWFTGRVTRFHGPGSIRIVVAHENITAHKQAEEQLKERERLAAIGVTAATFAHKVGNPLNSISTTLQLLDRRLANLTGPLDDKILAPVRSMTSEIARLTTLLGEFRALTRRKVLDLKRIQVATLVEDFFAQESPGYAAHNVEVNYEIAPDLPLLSVDREKLIQVLRILCTNAVEAMPYGGTLTLRVTLANEQITFALSDTGGGVPVGVDIFEPFVTTKAQGSGLGLTIGRQIVSLLGGSLSYHSRLGQGTTFIMTLPVSQKQN